MIQYKLLQCFSSEVYKTLSQKHHLSFKFVIRSYKGITEQGTGEKDSRERKREEPTKQNNLAVKEVTQQFTTQEASTHSVPQTETAFYSCTGGSAARDWKCPAADQGGVNNSHL